MGTCSWPLIRFLIFLVEQDYERDLLGFISFLHGYWAVGSWMEAGVQTDEMCLDSFLIGFWFLWYR